MPRANASAERVIWNGSAVAKNPSLDELWDLPLPGYYHSPPPCVSPLPEAAARYLEHAIAPGTRLASSVRLRMHGQIKLKQWLPFTAEQVIHQRYGMIWKAAVRRSGMIIRGFDRLLNGKAAMKWKLFGLIPVMSASGPDIDRSAAGRLMAESVWLPSILCANNIIWTARDNLHPCARLVVGTEAQELSFSIDDEGRLQNLHLQRWGNPESREFHYVSFGGVVEEERAFGGYTIPTRLRVGWHFGTDRFETEGEFFRVTIDDATYR